MGDQDLGLRYWGRQRVTRRRVLASSVAGTAALGAFALVGCKSDNKGNGDGAGGSSSTPVINDGYQDGAGKPGGILRVRQGGALPSMNVFGPGIFALAQGLTLGFTTFDHMWYVPTDTGKTELFLATKLEQPDATTVIATLGEATFQDKDPVNGRAVDAEDVVQSFKRFKEAGGIGFNFLENVMDDIVAMDDRTVKITTKFPWAWVFTSSNAGSPLNCSILPKEILHDHDDLLQKDAIGSGHWILKGHENGTNLKFRKFDKFRTFQNGRDITGQPYMDGVDFVFITDDNAGLAAFKAGEIDTSGFTSRKQMEDTAAELGERIRTASDLSRDYVNMMMRADAAPFNDIRVRQAFSKLVDREEAILLLQDGDAVKCGPMPPAHKRYVLPDDDAALKDYYTPDIAGAKQLLAAAAFDLDQEIEMKHSNRPVDSELAQVLKEQLGRGGVKIKLVQEDLVKWFSQTLNQSDFKMTCFQHLPYEDPDLPLRFFLGKDATLGNNDNFMKWTDPEVNDAILAAAKELDEEARVELVKEAQRVIIKQAAPMVNVLSQINFGGSYQYVKGGVSGRGSYGLFNRTTWFDDEERRAQKD